MNRLFKSASFVLLSGLTSNVLAFELLSEGAMGTVSAVSANSVEEIVNVAGPTAAGLTVDEDEYELLPFKTDIVVGEANPSEVTDGLEFSLTQEVESWASSLRAQEDLVGLDTGGDVGYIDELPPSAFEESVLIIRDEEFDSIIFDSDPDQEDEASFELSRIEQTVKVLEDDLDSIRYIIERKLDFAATLAPTPNDDQPPAIGSAYISDITSVSNVRIATVRD